MAAMKRIPTSGTTWSDADYAERGLVWIRGRVPTERAAEFQRLAKRWGLTHAETLLRLLDHADTIPAPEPAAPQKRKSRG